jgi:uncharacterized membrane-anchored protein YhcB (DUF1043 family)
MDLMSFTFGILAMIGLLFIVTIIVGFVKVGKHERKLKDLEVLSEECFKRLNETCSEINNELVNQTNRVEDLLMKEIERIDRDVQEARSYTDSRIDKIKN